MKAIAERIKKHTRTTNSHIGNNGRAVVGLVNVGVNPHVESYWFELLDKLEPELNTHAYMSDGAVGLVDLDKLRDFPIPEARKRTALKFVREGKFTALEGRLICAGIETKDAWVYGLEDRELFVRTQHAFVLTSQPSTKMLYDEVRSKITQHSQSKQASESRVKQWRQELSDFSRVIELRLMPGDIVKTTDTYGSSAAVLLSDLERYIDEEEVQELRRRIQGGIDFYQATETRSRIMLEKIVSRFEETGISIAIVSATGYHWPYFEEQLRKRGYTYVTIMPDVDFSIINDNPNIGQGQRLFDRISGRELPLKEEFLSLQRKKDPWGLLISSDDPYDELDNEIEEAKREHKDNPDAIILSVLSPIMMKHITDPKSAYSMIDYVIESVRDEDPVNALSLAKKALGEAADKYEDDLGKLRREVFLKTLVAANGDLEEAHAITEEILTNYLGSKR